MATITQLEYLLAVDRTRHFGRAAKECHVSQPSLSMQLQKLEEELDCIVFDRSKKPILVTEQGKIIVEQAKKVIHEHKRLIEISHNKDNEVKGEFHLAVIPTLASSLVPLFLKKFAEAYPEVKLRVSEYKTDDIIKLLIDDKIDAALAVTPLKDQRLIEKVLFYEPFYAYVSTDHEFKKKKSIKESELKGRDVWLLNEGHCMRNQVMTICSLREENPMLTNISLESGSLETLVNLVRQNSGYTLLPHLTVENLSSSEKQNQVKSIENPTPTREVSLVYSRSFLKEPIINALEKEILETIPANLKSLKKSYSIIDI